MALMSCPECSKEISDLVKSCPHCGFPIGNSENETQKVEISSVRLKLDETKKKKYLKIGAIGIVLLLVSFFTLNFVGKAQEKKIAEENKNIVAQYRMKILSVQSTMLSTGADAEELINLTSNVWSNSIREKDDPETNKYTKVDGYGAFWTDFNISLGKLFSDPVIMEKVLELKLNEESINGLMKDIQNPPNNYSKVYETLLEAHGDLTGVVSLAKSPKGNLTSFNQESREKIDSFLTNYKKIDTILPNDELK